MDLRKTSWETRLAFLNKNWHQYEIKWEAVSGGVNHTINVFFHALKCKKKNTLFSQSAGILTLLIIKCLFSCQQISKFYPKNSDWALLQKLIPETLYGTCMAWFISLIQSSGDEWSCTQTKSWFTVLPSLLYCHYQCRKHSLDNNLLDLYRS